MESTSAINAVRFGFLIATILQTLEEISLNRCSRSFLVPPVSRLRQLGYVRLFLGVAIFFRPEWLVLWGVLFVITLGRSLVFFGSLNGGSDAMTQVVLLGLGFAAVFDHSPLGVNGALYWIGIQSTLSYFLSGIRKARNPDWWTGSALQSFLLQSRVRCSFWNEKWIKNPGSLRMISLLVLGYELLFPLAWVSLPAAWTFVSLGFLFHFSIFLSFGLNRFFWIWVSTYPAIVYLASRSG